MTQGEILSALTPIDTMINICNSNRKSWISINDVNSIIPFVAKAQKAAEKLSRFALDYFNSHDEHKRELSKLVCKNFSRMLSDIKRIKFNGYRDDTTVDWLNNNIRCVNDLLNNTVEACESLVDVLPPPTAKSGKKVNDKKLSEKAGTTNNDENTDTGEEDNLDEDNNEEVDVEKTSSSVKQKEIPYDASLDHVFDERVNVEEIKKALDKITTFDKRKHPFWFVAMKVFNHLRWVPTTTQTKDFLAWASLQYNLEWTTKRQLSFSEIGGDPKHKRNHERVIKNKDITLWHTITSRDFRDIEKYRNFALLLKKTFVHYIVNRLEQENVNDFNIGIPRDRVIYMKDPKNLINSGK